MKILSDSMLKALNSQSPCYARKFILYRKVWNDEQKKYIFGDGFDLTPFVIQSGEIKWKLDNEGYGIWNNAGMAITISARAGIFEEKQNNLLYGARIDVYGGIADEEYTKIFRGFIMREPSYNQEAREYIVNLSGELACLSSYGALDLSVVKNNVLIASRAGQSEAAEDENYFSFELPDKAVGAVLEARIGSIDGGFEGASVLKEVNEYEVSSLNSPKYPAKITLLNALPAGCGLWVSYRVWHTNKTIEWILEKTLELCGDPEREIEELNYEGTIEAFFNQPSDADFLQGTHDYALVNSSSVTLPSTFLKDANFDWIIVSSGNLPFEHLTPNSVGIGDGILDYPGIVAAPCEQAYGTWEVECSTLRNEVITQYYYYLWEGAEPLIGQGYCFQHSKYDSFRLFFAFFKVSNSGTEQMGMVWMDRDNQTYRVRYRICRYPDGSIRFMVKPLTPVEGPWKDFGIVCTDNEYQVCNYQAIILSNYGNNHFYSIKLSPQAATGSGDVAPYANYYSPIIDGGGRLKNWKSFTASDELNGGSSSYYTRSRDEETSPWSDWKSITSGSAIEESGRYLQLRWLGQSDAAQTTVPKLKYWQAEWDADGVSIAMLNTSSLTCLDIVQELARLSGYQIGFDSEGKFFFKSRPSLTTPCLKLGKSEIIKVESVSGGLDKLYNRVSVNFGNYSCVVDDFTLNKARPNLIDKYGLKELALSSGSLLPAQNANLARACAPGIFTEVSKIKKRAAVLCRFLPQIELGDVVEVDYGDVLKGNMMVEGLEFNLSDWALRLDLCSWES